MNAPADGGAEAHGPDEVLDYGEALHRLRGRCRWAGPLVALLTLLPYEIVDGHPQFPWHLVGELPPAGMVACLAPAVAGAVVFAASYAARRVLSLAVVVLAALGGAALLVRLGADASAWDVLALPDSVARRPHWALLALALTAAGSLLTARAHTRRPGRALLVGAALFALGFYAWPGAGEAPITTIVRLLGALDADLPLGLNLGFVLFAVLALWPGTIALLGLLHVRRPPADGHPTLAIIAVYGLPFVLATQIFPRLLVVPTGWLIFASLGHLAVAAALVALLAAAVEGLVDGLVTLPPGGAPRRLLAVTTAVLAVTVGGQAWLARPPEKGVEWTLRAPTPAADALFGRLVPAWDRERMAWDRRVRRGSGARAALAVKQAERAMLRAAAEIDPGLEAAVRTLARESRDLGLAGRRWYRLVAGVNEAARRAGLPYYLDPTALVFQTRDGLRRFFRVRSYRVHRVRRFDVDGERYATLHVERLDGPSGNDMRLGFSRDLQPFALVSVGEVDGFEFDLAETALADPPRCGRPTGWPDRDAGLARCGALLASLLERTGGDLGPAITALTERHELQHQIDGPHLPVAGPVLARLGRYGERTQRRVNRELSAYLAEITTPEAPPQLGLIHLVRFVLQGDGGVAFEVAVLALSALAGRPPPTGDVDRAALLAAFDELARLSDDALRARAAETWSDLFGDDLAQPVPLD